MLGFLGIFGVKFIFFFYFGFVLNLFVMLNFCYCDDVFVVLLYYVVYLELGVGYE